MNCIIVDDEPLAREGLSTMIEEVGGLKIEGSFNSTEKAALFLKDNTVDLIFLDIEMPDANGMDFGKKIGNDMLIVFTTAYSSYALESYETNAIDYLLKPIEFSKLERAIAKVATYKQLLLQKENVLESITGDFLLIKAERRFYKILFEQILFVEALKDYVIIHTTNNDKVITAMNLKTIHLQLPQGKFIRVSKSYVVNVIHINSFDPETIHIGTHEIPIGKVYQKVFYQQYLGNKAL